MGIMKPLLLLLLLAPGIVLAQPIVINEIAWMGTPVQGVAENQWWRYEWLELFNTTDVPVSLNGWFIELRRESLDFTIHLAGGIPAKGYFLVVSSGKISQSNTNYANLGGKFFNGGQQVLLKDAQVIVQDEIDAKEGWPAGDNETKQTMERTDPPKESLPAGQAGSDLQNWHTSEVAGGSPGQENSKMLEAGPPASLREALRAGKEKTGPLIKPVSPPLPLHFVLALAVALALAPAAVWLRRYFLKRADSFGGPEH